LISRATLPIGLIAFFLLVLLSKTTCAAISDTAKFPKAVANDYIVQPFRNLNSNDGLSQNNVYDIVQDELGFLWFATNDGLNRFDGYSFTYFKHDPNDPSSLGDKSVYRIALGKDGLIWTGSRTAGVSVLNPRTGKFKRYRNDPTNENTLSDDDVRDISVDHTGNVWIGTAAGLNRFVPETGGFERFQHDSSNVNSLPGNQIWSVYADSEGKIWTGGYWDYGVTVFDPVGRKFTRHRADVSNPDSLSNGYVVHIAGDQNGEIWISTRNGGLNRYNPKTKKFRRYSWLENDPTTINATDLWGALLVDSRNNVWVGSFSEGLCVYDRQKDQFQRIVHDPDDRGSICGNAIRSLFEDRTGLIWIGSGGGLSIHDPLKEQFRLYRKTSSHSENFAGLQIICITRMANNDLWIGTSDEGIYVRDDVTGIFKNYRHEPGNPESIRSNSISGISQDKNGKIWVGTFGTGLCLFDETRKSFTYKGGFWISHLTTDLNGDVWILGAGDFLRRYDAGEDAFVEFPPAGDNPKTINTSRLITARADESGKIWLAGYSNLYSYDQASSEFKMYEDSLLNSNTIYFIYPDNEKFIWLCTANGLIKWNKKELRSEKVYTTADGLPSEIVSSVLRDAAGNLWLGTNKGLCRLNVTTGETFTFDFRDGLPSNEFNAGCTVDEDGTIYMGTLHGLISFNPKRIETYQYQPHVVITGLTVLNKKWLTEEEIFYTDEITLSYREYFFGIEFSAMDYTCVEKTKYRYRMSGFNENWVELGEKNYLSFTNLDQGNYVLEIQACNAHGIWSTQSATIGITISPPFWKTSWFISLCILLIVVGFYLFYRWRTASLVKSKKILETKVEERTLELKDKNEQLSELYKDITSSIDYARIIQQSLLPGAIEFTQHFSDSFIYFAPKDAVSGDFYWIEKLHNGQVCVAAADSTGHGVPGAIMSILNITCLEIAVSEGLTHPAEILNHTRKNIIARLKKGGSSEGGRDGMDCCLVSFDKTKNQIHFALANNPLWLIRRDTKDLIEFKPDKMPVGKHDKQEISFTKNQADIQKGDTIYLFTDGYADQFGGEKGKKFKYSSLKELLISISDRPLSEQKSVLDATFNSWKGQLEQIDDVCIIGLRI